MTSVAISSITWGLWYWDHLKTLDRLEDCDRRPGIRVFAANRFLFALRGVVADGFVDDVAVAVGHAEHNG